MDHLGITWDLITLFGNFFHWYNVQNVLLLYISNPYTNLQPPVTKHRLWLLPTTLSIHKWATAQFIPINSSRYRIRPVTVAILSLHYPQGRIQDFRKVCVWGGGGGRKLLISKTRCILAHVPRARMTGFFPSL